MPSSATVYMFRQNPAHGNIPDWLEKVCRVGLCTKGVVCVTLEVLAATAAFSAGGSVHTASGDLKKRLRLGSMSKEVRKSVTTLGRGGFAARGVVFLIIGFLMAKAGLFSNPNQAVGGALRELVSQTSGTVVLGIVAIGLAAYGAYMIFASRHRAIPAP
mgnify:CR=1 FL=1